MHRLSRSRGSVLLLVPAAVVIVLLLGTIAVDSAVVFLAQRQAANAALDAANDAAVAGLDRPRLRAGELVLDEERVRSVAAATVAAATPAPELVSVVIEPGPAVTVTVRYRIDRVFGPAFGTDRSTTRTVAATARPRTTP